MRWTLALAVVLVSLPARGETRRLAIVVGNNAGEPGNPILHYAETDAGKMAEVLVQLGGIAPADLFLLQGRSLAQIRETLAAARERVTEWHQQADQRVALLFYFSGHSDGQALEVGAERLSYADLRRWLADSGAEVKVAIVDSCHSGALLAKGASRGPAFEIHLQDDLTSTGEAFLTSSAAGELALESSEIRGSFFTHHLVSGLRGAADTSGDGRVTLAEAYDYAFAHTVSATSGTAVGAQHPGYDYRLSGQGELVLSELNRPGGSVVLPDPFDRALVTDLLRDRVLAELVRGQGTRVVLPPGEYSVQAWSHGEARAGRFPLREGQSLEVRWSELAPVVTSLAAAKGSLEVAAAPSSTAAANDQGLSLLVAGGVGRGVATELGPQPSLRLGVRPDSVWGWLASVEAQTGTAPGFRETTALVFGGVAGALRFGELRIYLGAEAGGGAIVQAPSAGAAGASPALAIAPVVGLDFGLFPRVAVALEGNCPVAAVELSGRTGLVVLPAAWLGVRTSL